jgi:small-conductance mechanosensitive channel
MEPGIVFELATVRTWPAFALAVAIVAAASALAALLLHRGVRLLARHRGWDYGRIGRIIGPFLTLVAVTGMWIAVRVTLPLTDWLDAIGRVALILVIASAAWLLSGVIAFAFGAVRARYPIDVADNGVARRVRTQLGLLQRIASVVLVILALGAILLTFPGVQALGASVLASAGLVSVIAGLAAQSTLSNLFAGVQLAFSDALRVDDVVVVENEWGRIEEMTLSYVVVRIWDERRLVLPSTYFTTTPFTNWTRASSDITGTVYVDLDWTVPLDGLRERFETFLATRDDWDGRGSSVAVTDATGGGVQVRFVVTAADSGSLWNLRCAVREDIVRWAQSVAPVALPRTRVDMVRD